MAKLYAGPGIGGPINWLGEVVLKTPKTLSLDASREALVPNLLMSARKQTETVRNSRQNEFTRDKIVGAKRKKRGKKDNQQAKARKDRSSKKAR